MAVRGIAVLSRLLDDADRTRSARPWRNLPLSVRYATATMRAHAARLADQAALVSTLEERALVVELPSDRERTLDAASAAAGPLDGLTADPEARPGPGGRPRGRQASPRRARTLPRGKGVYGHPSMARSGAGSALITTSGDGPSFDRIVRASPPSQTRPFVRRSTGGSCNRGYVPGLGNVVIPEHGDDCFTVYGHLGAVRATPGSEVARGETIATAGSSGLTEEPSIYFEVRHGAEALDPRGWLEPDTGGIRRPKGSRGRT